MIKQLEDKRKGSKPAPTHGIMSVVVAEIEGFTALMKRSPDLMLRALVTYNSVLLKAKSVNFGHVIEQEGVQMLFVDSYTFVFEDPVDAVKFCLQVQLLLAKQRWPRGLFRDVDSDDINNSGKGSGNKSNLTAASGGVRSMLTGVNQRMKRMVHDNRVGQADFSLDSTGSGNLTNDGDSSLARGTLSSEGPNRANPTFKRLTQAGSLNVTGPGSSIYARTTIERSSQRATSVPNASTAASREPSGSGLLPTVLAGGVHGLRVRTGVAAGLVKAGFGVIGCALHQRAKLITDAGSGGQILMCEASFAAVKDKTQELGCMTEEGLDLEHLEDYGWWSKWWRSKESAKSKGAILLDMGEYMLCPEGTGSPLIMCLKESQTTLKPNHYALQHDDEAMQGMDPKQKRGSADSRRHSQVGLGSLSSQAQPMSSQNGGREGSFAKSSTMSTQQPYDPRALMRIYQVLAPSQELRGIMFGNMMALKEEWVCVDDSYYNAPGIVPFTTNITEVTCVFCQVDNVKQFAARHRQDTLLLGLELVCILRSVARQINGSYFVKQQDSDLKYMFVFSKAEDALLWCLSVQFCVLYSDWPASVLHHWPEEHGADGRLLFRGPRLKMGVCTGTPSSIIPDHMGRADYLGPCINMAARFMDAAAHGGQIACTMQQAFDAVYSWSNWARFSSMMQPVHSSSKGQSGHGAGGRDNGLSHDKVTELEPDPSHPAPEWMLEPIVEAMPCQGHAHQPHAHDTFVSVTTKNHTKVDQTSPILHNEVKAKHELLSQEKHVVELSSEEELPCKSDQAAGFLVRQTGSEKVELSNGVFDELKNAASLDYRASSTPSLHLHRPSTLGEGEGVEAGQQMGGEGRNSMLRTSCIGSISAGSVQRGGSDLDSGSLERDSECEDSCEVGRDEAGKYRVPAVVLTGGPVGESSRDNEASVSGVGMNPSHGRALAQSREEEEQEVVRSYDDGRDIQVGVVQDRWADASSSKVKEDEDMDKRQRRKAGAGAGMEGAEHAQANKASTFFSTGASVSSIQTERDKLMLRPSMPLGTGPSAASKTQRAVNNALTARKSLPLGNFPSTISTSINLTKGQSVPLPRISRPSFLPSPAVRGTSLPTPSSSGPVEGMQMGPPQQQGAHGQFHAEELQEELHRSVLNTIVDGGCEEEDEAVQDVEDITWWAPVDNVVPGRWLDVTVYWTGRYLFKGSPEALTMVNVTPAWLCERRYPEESPKGKGMILSILQGEASTSLVPLLKVVEAYRELCPVPHLPHIGLDTLVATVAHSLATSRVAISRIPSGHTARSSPAFSGDGSGRSIDATSGADTSAFKLI
ncbi:hypothetical protein CEUSTIGMA_g6728.t1 [Chlamydomonas eustigma]|uniref:Guanylate cyclase domain-containing protein n=1 Tax=Chlamydomonas eustigma TaxID=1157962 RepID=A0A250X8A3_9CHLO|nr:hypothetical protein CEUSTIGMA_g6728.t1 [Chlamydomonas eustigma]|eukprot:GAX79287.1 hypothetical protein CEUSTIGMA_g6728.t1 [Chlamydomonas eustigma]